MKLLKWQISVFKWFIRACKTIITISIAHTSSEVLTVSIFFYELGLFYAQLGLFDVSQMKLNFWLMAFLLLFPIRQIWLTSSDPSLTRSRRSSISGRRTAAAACSTTCLPWARASPLWAGWLWWALLSVLHFQWALWCSLVTNFLYTNTWFGSCILSIWVAYC